jgi:adenylosuccinate synthase
MSVKVVIGTQWGDEGKGKIVDYFAKDADYVVRFQGGNNAGHTIKIEDEIYKLHIVPSGVISGKTGVIGNGCVVDPEVLSKEINDLKKRNINPKIIISNRVNMIMPYHKLLDGAEERILADKKIGTTKRGIGPCYSDKISRYGIRASDLINKEYLSEKLDRIIPIKQKIIDAYGIKEKLNKNSILNSYVEYGQLLKDYIKDTHVILNKAIESGENVLFEGAQGIMLDVDFGTYPYTTSSHVITGGACIGTGVPPRYIAEVVGIVKAYTTRVGEGPMPTELLDDTGKLLQEKGHEFGTTTSRPRRCGWLDLIVVKHSCMLSGISKIAITKLDVLNGFKKLYICKKYKLNGKEIDVFPASIQDVKICKPVYEELKGWKDLGKPQNFSELPSQAKDYLSYIEKYLDIKIKVLSYGPERNETLEI